MTRGAWTIEPATVISLPHILKIEEACFSAPWTRKMLEAELSGNPFAHFLLAKQPGGQEEEGAAESIVGYLCYWIVFEEIRLMNLAVIESMRHRGIARALVTAALTDGTLTIRPSRPARSARIQPRRANPLSRIRVSSDSRQAKVLPQSRGRCRVDGIGPDNHRNRDPASMFAIMREAPDRHCDNHSPGRYDMLTDNVIVERLRQSNTEFRELEESHHRLDLELNRIAEAPRVDSVGRIDQEAFAQRKVGEKRQDGRADSRLSRSRVRTPLAH